MTLPSFSDLAAAIYVDGSSVDKAKVRAWGLTVQTALNALISNGTVLLNGKLAASVSGNALTIAVKTQAGNDPSASDPVYAFFRSSTLTSGDQSIVAITSALSIVVPSGATLGASNNVNARFWLVIFNNAGTCQLGIVNMLSGSNLLGMMEGDLISSTLTPANSAQVVYTTGSAVTTKAWRWLGYVSYETALATAGTYSAAPDVVQMCSPGSRLPGDPVQRVRSADATTASGTTTTPLDNTIPQNTEGSQFMSQAITPKSKCNLLKIQAKLIVSSSAVVHLIAALHQDSVANALMAKAVYAAATNVVVEIDIEHWMLTATVSATTFKINIGGSAAATVRLNGVSGAQIFNGVAFSALQIDEYMA